MSRTFGCGKLSLSGLPPITPSAILIASAFARTRAHHHCPRDGRVDVPIVRTATIRGSYMVNMLLWVHLLHKLLGQGCSFSSQDEPTFRHGEEASQIHTLVRALILPPNVSFEVINTRRRGLTAAFRMPCGAGASVGCISKLVIFSGKRWTVSHAHGFSRIDQLPDA